MARSHRRQNLRYTVALVGDGHTESIYFSDLKDTDRPDNLHIQPDFPTRFGSYEGVLDRAIALRTDFDRVYALVDMDAILAHNQLAAYQKCKAKAVAKKVTVLENNPCFEIWLLLHFKATGRLFRNCQDVIQELRKFIPDYEKSKKYLYAARLYHTHRELIRETAIPNAMRLEVNRQEQDALYPRAEVYKFFDWYFARQV
jgi:hypothetical protein